MIRLLPVLASLALVACGQAEPARESTTAPTIVSLNPCTDAILAEVAGPEQLLALSHYSHAPQSTSMNVAKAQQYGVTGGTVEEILALQPDIVVASSFMPPAARAALDDLGIPVVTFGIAATISDSHQQIRDLARLAGAEDRGERLIARIDRALDSALYDGDPLSAVVWQPSGIVPGDNALVSAMMRHSGLTSHSAAIGMEQADYLSLEAMLANPPDILLIAGQERSQHHPALAKLGGTHRAILDSGLLYCGGPTIIRLLHRLADVRDAAL
ncbi:ABC transporter substrate-binding protein [Pontixanthobacter sp.]|uniref:ABC transporter substrate-binding protein n=1 Tax=Pontixanthobacter sp. TaxID=2792078 RepID=UPI003C7D0667